METAGDQSLRKVMHLRSRRVVEEAARYSAVRHLFPRFFPRVNLGLNTPFKFEANVVGGGNIRIVFQPTRQPSWKC